MYILNDHHLGVKRVAGTTPVSTLMLQQYLVDNFEKLLKGINEDVCVLGDLFDSYLIDLVTIKLVANVIREWLNKNTDCGFVMVRGNHDAINNIGSMGSLDFLMWLLEAEYDCRIQYITEPEYIVDTYHYVIPHLQNQDLFNTALDNVPAEASTLLLHANYDNFFATEADHSLNISESQAIRSNKKGTKIFLGHEHSARRPSPHVHVLGNQFPSSISDCKGQAKKYYHYLNNDTCELVKLDSWCSDEYTEIDCHALMEKDGEYFPTNNVKFVRIVGACTATEAPQVIRAIAYYRKKSEAFIVSNAVKIEGLLAMEDLPDNMEDAKSFDALEALFSMLAEEHVSVIKKMKGAANDK